jgi:hypothetical protein
MPPHAAQNTKWIGPNRAWESDASDGVGCSIHADRAKAAVLASCGKLVADGFAEWLTLESGDIWFRLRTGETFLLETATVTRIT